MWKRSWWALKCHLKYTNHFVFSLLKGENSSGGKCNYCNSILKGPGSKRIEFAQTSKKVADCGQICCVLWQSWLDCLRCGHQTNMYSQDKAHRLQDTRKPLTVGLYLRAWWPGLENVSAVSHGLRWRAPTLSVPDPQGFQWWVDGGPAREGLHTWPGLPWLMPKVGKMCSGDGRGLSLWSTQHGHWL